MPACLPGEAPCSFEIMLVLAGARDALDCARRRAHRCLPASFGRARTRCCLGLTMLMPCSAAGALVQAPSWNGDLLHAQRQSTVNSTRPLCCSHPPSLGLHCSPAACSLVRLPPRLNSCWRSRGRVMHLIVCASLHRAFGRARSRCCLGFTMLMPYSPACLPGEAPCSFTGYWFEIVLVLAGLFVSNRAGARVGA